MAGHSSTNKMESYRKLISHRPARFVSHEDYETHSFGMSMYMIMVGGHIQSLPLVERHGHPRS